MGCDSRHAVAEPGVRELVDDDVDERTVAGKECCVIDFHKRKDSKTTVYHLLGVRKVRQAFS